MYEIFALERQMVMHLDMVFQCVNDGVSNSVHWMKDWHETFKILEHGNICKKKVHELKHNTKIFLFIPHINFPSLKCA